MTVPAYRSFDAPLADRVEVLEREAERIHHAVAGVAGRLGAVLLHDLAHRAGLLAVLVLLEPFDVGRRRRRRRAEDVLENPGAAQHRRGAVGVGRGHQHAAFAEQPPAVGDRSSVTRRNWSPRTFGNAVVQRQPLVDERVVGGQQVEHAAVLAQDAVDEQLDLAAERLAQAVVEIRERRPRPDRCCRSPRTFSHWNAKLVTSDFDSGSASSRRTCASSTSASRSRALLGGIEQLVVRRPAGEEERQARREIEIADAVDGARRDVVRQPLGAVQKLRAGQNRRQRRPGCRCRNRPSLAPS